MRQDHEAGFILKRVVHPAHIRIHLRANAPAGCEEIFSYIHPAFHLTFGNRLAVLVYKGEFTTLSLRTGRFDFENHSY